ncbi:MG3 domain-containing protein [Trichonephila clavipes]|nr:MG3 domain-containing protein [Trichonephila clavipes]
MPLDYGFVQQLKNQMNHLKPLSTSTHGFSKIFVHPKLDDCSHVFLRVDKVSPSLSQPYTGPHEVLSRNDKHITININGKKSCVSLDRVKPAFVFKDLPDTIPDPIISAESSHRHPVTTNMLTTKSGRRIPGGNLRLLHVNNMKEYKARVQTVGVAYDIFEEFVLPTFTVELKTPEIILESDKDIVLTVKAQYVYGEKVQGTVTYRLGVKGEAPQVTYFAIVAPKKLRDGSHQQFVSTNEFALEKDIGWFSPLNGLYLVVEATVMEDETGNKEVAIDTKGRFSKTPFAISFNRCLQDFKPGLISVFESRVHQSGGPWTTSGHRENFAGHQKNVEYTKSS